MRRQWLIDLRGQRTQEQISAMVGISRSTYSNIELGIRNPSVKMARSIALAMEFDWALFFDQEGFDTKHTEKTA